VRLGGVRKKGGYLQAQFHRLRARRGAIGAVAASMLTNGTLYQDPGGDYFDKRTKAIQTKRLVARLTNL
jgi:transposase